MRLIISQEQSWPSGLLQYLTSHEWAQWGFVNLFFRTKFTACWSNIVLSRCFYWTLSKTISSIVHIKHSLSFVWVAVTWDYLCVCVCIWLCVKVVTGAPRMSIYTVTKCCFWTNNYSSSVVYYTQTDCVQIY